MTILLTAGERVPVDGRVLKGQSDLDCSLVSGESIPQVAGAGTLLQAGTLNLTGPLTITATAAAKDSFLAEMIQMMEAAESGRSTYRRIADRASRLYAPVVHLTAAGDVHRLDGCNRRHPPGAHHRHRGPDHHMSLRARPRRSHGAGRCRASPVRAGHHGQGWRRARTPRRSGYRGLRQDRHAHASASRGLLGERCDRSRRAGAGCRDRIAFPPSLFARARAPQAGHVPARRSR